MKSRTRHAARGAARIVMFALALGFPLIAAGEEIDQTLSMPVDGLVSVENVAGTVEFVAWDRAEVQIRGEAGSSVEEVEINSTSTGVEVRRVICCPV